MTDLRRPPLLAALAGLLALFLWVTWRQPPRLLGDGYEYYLMLRSLAAHGTPEAKPEDIAATAALLRPLGFELPNPPPGFFPSTREGLYGYHFWFYSLLGVPLRWLGLGFSAFYGLNIGLVLVTSALVLRCRAIAAPRRVALLLLSLVSPVLWYIKWPHPEVFTWCCVLLALVGWEAKRPVWATLAASLGALQNPPVLFLSLLIFVVALREKENRSGKRLLGLIVALGVAFVPMAFFFIHFQALSMIAKVGGSNPGWITLERVASLFGDLNQGLFFYVPLLLCLGLAGILKATRQRRYKPLLLGATLLLFAIAAATTNNWNSCCSGVMRYGVWMLPVLAWLALESKPSRWMLTTAICLQALIVLYDDPMRSERSPGNVFTYTEHLRLARMVLNRAPWLYNPEPEIFVERTLGSEPTPPWKLPVAYHAGERISKILVDDASFSHLPEKFIPEPLWWAQVQRECAGKRGFFYLNPPPGAVKDREIKKP
ncbi:hypothetical protein [Armatimonas sp.]|uniref:hypothetical protein n=1 Tax=Armatimonas sp. TaxID=1872638 RepID=UPI003751E2FD